MVEAAMVFPVIIIAVMSVIGMLIYFYSQLSEQVHVHSVLRHESGEISGNMKYSPENSGGETIYREGNILYCYEEIPSIKKWMLESKSKSKKTEKYLIDEVSLVRFADLAERSRDEE